MLGRGSYSPGSGEDGLPAVFDSNYSSNRVTRLAFTAVSQMAIEPRTCDLAER